MDEKPEPQRRRARQTALPGNHPYWTVGGDGFASWKPIKLSAIFPGTAEIALNIPDLLEEYDYIQDEQLSREQYVGRAGLLICVYFALDAEDLDSPNSRYPYVLHLILGEFDEYALFCPSLPALMATLAGIGPAIAALTPPRMGSDEEDDEDDENDEDEALLAMLPEEIVISVELGEYDTVLVQERELSPVAFDMAYRAIASGTYSYAVRVCDHVVKLLPFDGHVGRAEVALLRGRIAEAQRDLDGAASHYHDSLHQLGDIAFDSDDEESPRLAALMDLVRVESLRRQFTEAEDRLNEADRLIAQHDATPHPCHLRADWCLTAGDLYTAQWRSGAGDHIYEQAITSYEQAMELAQVNQLTVQQQRARERIWMLQRAYQDRA